jgi:hypothetical protein
MPKPVAHPRLRLVKPPPFFVAQAQPHFVLSKAGDPLEMEADRTAQAALAAPRAGFSFSAMSMEHGQPEAESTPEAEDEKRDEKKRGRREHRKVMKPGDDEGGMISRKMHANRSPVSLSARAGEAGHPLEPRTRADMESRFGHDFGHVRVVTDSQAAESARGVSAQAYTRGSQIVFGAGRYAPRSPQGRELLAHELAHVVQNDNGRMAASTIMRRTGWESFKIWIGAEEGDFSDEELQEYLKLVTENNKHQDSYDSDNKARAIVRLWKAGNRKFNLTVRQKILLIQEMQAGPTLDEDERGILDLLEYSDDSDLRIIFGPGNIDVKDLNSDIDGAEYDELKEFYEQRFEGGMEALKKGEVKPRGGAPKGAPAFPYEWAVLKAHFEEAYTDSDTLDYVRRLTPDEKKQAIADMQAERIRKKEALDAFVGKLYRAGGTPSEEDRKKRKAMWNYTVKIDAILAAQYAEAASEAKGKKKAEILKETTGLSADQKAAARQALSPEVKPKTPGTADTFADAVGYEKELRDKLDKDIKAMYEGMVENKEEKEHGDSARTYPLKRFEELANVAQQETDPVFEGYVPKRSPKAGPVFKADAKGAPGNVHDLWAELDKQLKDDAKVKGTFRRDLARQLIFYDLQSDEEVLNIINREHFAAPEFKDGEPDNDEAKIQAKLAKEYTNTPEKVEKLNKIDRGWEATANFKKREINVQIFKPVDEKTKKVDETKDRFFLWGWFQTMIHEYCHTLVNSAYRDYAVSFGTSSVQYNTLMEGVDSWLDEVAWAAIEPKAKSKELREKVEGTEYAKKDPLATYPSITRQRYPTFDQAMQLVNLVGPKNIYAAYFFGRTDLIGKEK